MHLVGFVIRIYHNARSPEHQIKIFSNIFTAFVHVTDLFLALHLIVLLGWAAVDAISMSQHQVSNMLSVHLSIKYPRYYQYVSAQGIQHVISMSQHKVSKMLLVCLSIKCPGCYQHVSA